MDELYDMSCSHYKFFSPFLDILIIEEGGFECRNCQLNYETLSKLLIKTFYMPYGLCFPNATSCVK